YNDSKALTRSSASGSRQQFVDQAGDITPAREHPPTPFCFSVEVKWHGPRQKKGRMLHEPWMIEDALFTKKASVLQYWKQCRDAAKATHKIPLLLLKKNRRKWIAGVQHTDWEHIRAVDLQKLSTPHTPGRALLIPRSGLLLIPLTWLLANTSPAAWLDRWRSRYEPVPAATAR